MDFNAAKCHVIKFGNSGTRPGWEYELGNDRLQVSEKAKDLRVVIKNRLSPEDHIKEKVKNMSHWSHFVPGESFRPIGVILSQRSHFVP